MMAPMPSMTAVSKEMHEDHAEQENKRKVWGKMPPMVDHKIDPNDDNEADKHRVDSLIFHTVFSLSPRYPTGYLYKQ